MVVIQQQIPMPSGCNTCPLCDHDYGAHGGRQPYCRVLLSMTNKNWQASRVNDTVSKRPANCPVQDNHTYSI